QAGRHQKNALTSLLNQPGPEARARYVLKRYLRFFSGMKREKMHPPVFFLYYHAISMPYNVITSLVFAIFATIATHKEWWTDRQWAAEKSFRTKKERGASGSSPKSAPSVPCLSNSDQAGQRAGGIGVLLLGHAAGQIGQTAALDRQAHGAGHGDGVLGFGNGGVHQHAVAAQFHGDGGVRGGADPGIDQHRHRRLLDDLADVDRVLHAQ